MQIKVGVEAIALAVFFAVLPPAAAGGALGLPVLLCLTGALVWPAAFSPAGGTPSVPTVLLIALTLWLCVTALWAPVPAGERALKLIILVVLGQFFVGAAGSILHSSLVRALGIAAFIVLAALLSIEALGDLPLNRAANPHVTERLEVARNVFRGETVLLGLTWGAAGALVLAGRAWAACALILLSGLLSLPFGMSAHTLAWIAGVACFGLSFWRPRTTLLTVSAGLSGWLLAAPFLMPAVIARSAIDALPFSWAARVAIWDFVCAAILERPLMGHGLDASRHVTEEVVVQGVRQSAVPLHPHSASLQIWYETGAVGATLAAATLAAGGWAMSRAFASNRPAAAATAATLASLGVIANLSFGAWQEWWNATMFIAAALAAALSRRA